MTLKSLSEGYYMERGSKFHAYAFPVQTEDEVHSILQALKKEHPKARHFCACIRMHLLKDRTMTENHQVQQEGLSSGNL